MNYQAKHLLTKQSEALVAESFKNTAKQKLEALYVELDIAALSSKYYKLLDEIKSKLSVPDNCDLMDYYISTSDMFVKDDDALRKCVERMVKLQIDLKEAIEFLENLLNDHKLNMNNVLREVVNSVESVVRFNRMSKDKQDVVMKRSTDTEAPRVGKAEPPEPRIEPRSSITLPPTAGLDGSNLKLEHPEPNHVYEDTSN